MNLCDTSEYHQARMKMFQGLLVVWSPAVADGVGGTRRVEKVSDKAWSLIDETKGMDTVVMLMATAHEAVCFLLTGATPPLADYNNIDVDLAMFHPMTDAERRERESAAVRR
jgi:hypothetical protein